MFFKVLRVGFTYWFKIGLFHCCAVFYGCFLGFVSCVQTVVFSSQLQVHVNYQVKQEDFNVKMVCTLFTE